MCSKKNFQKHIQGFVADFGRFAHMYRSFLTACMQQKARKFTKKFQAGYWKFTWKFLVDHLKLTRNFQVDFPEFPGEFTKIYLEILGEFSNWSPSKSRRCPKIHQEIPGRVLEVYVEIPGRSSEINLEFPGGFLGISKQISRNFQVNSPKIT